MTDPMTVDAKVLSLLSTSSPTRALAALEVIAFADDGKAAHLDAARTFLSEHPDTEPVEAIGDMPYRTASVLLKVLDTGNDDPAAALDELAAATPAPKARRTRKTKTKDEQPAEPEPKDEPEADPVADKPAEPEPEPEPEPKASENDPFAAMAAAGSQDDGTPKQAFAAPSAGDVF